MHPSNAARFLEELERQMPEKDRPLLRRLHSFSHHRLESAREAGEEARRRESIARIQREMHRFLRESYGALNGVAREVNLCMHRMFPEAGLYPPHRLTRQCGLYMVRKILHESPETSSHPISVLLWKRTREPGDAAYDRLSFLYNLSLFIPLPLPEEGTMLPGSDDLPETARPFARDDEVEACRLEDGIEQMLWWTRDFGEECYGELTAALRDGT